MKPQLLLLIDAHALLHRAYHAIPPLTSQSGEPTNATFGFASTVLKVWREFEPDCVAMAFDVGRTFRHDAFDEYKANRAKAPDDLLTQFQRARDVAQSLGIPDYSVEGYEADDVLATLSDQASESGIEVIIVTGDSDVLQLVSDHVRVYMLGRKFSEGVLYDMARVKERYGLLPKQLIDLKGLSGDSSDNIPGVSGVGVKTATQLLQDYGSIEGIYENLDQVANRWRAKLDEGHGDALKSKSLVQLVHDVAVALDVARCSTTNYDRQTAMELFRELGFWRLVDRLPGGITQEAGAQLSLFGDEAPPVEGAVTGAYVVVDTEKALAKLAETLSHVDAFAFDTETTGVDPMLADLVGLSIAVAPGSAYYIPLGHAQGMGSNVSLAQVRARLAPFFADGRVIKCAHNASFDITVLIENGVPVVAPVFDTMIAAFLCNPGRRNLGLKQLAWERLGVEMLPITALIGQGRNQKTMDQVPVSQVAPYAGADADMTLQLVEPLRTEMAEKELAPLFDQVEMPLVPVLIEMERHGVALDVGYLAEMSEELSRRLHDLEQAIYEAAGHPFNVNSTKQLSDVLFVELGLPAPRRTQTGFSTDLSVLETLREQHAIVEHLIEHRQLSKIKSTYVDALPALVNPKTSRVHTSYKQTGAVTGRLSSVNPNLQNIPIRSELGRQVRRAFVAAPGSWLLEADYSQVELRVLAHISGDEGLTQAFLRGEDIHASTAASILGVPLQSVDQNQRRIAKSINFGIVYGMSGFGLARRTGLSVQEATEFIDNYFAKYPRVLAYLEETKANARKHGYVETLLGRRRYFPELRSGSRANRNLRQAAERMAINMPIQGTAADIMKLAMIKMSDSLHHGGFRTAMIMQVHDELVFEVPDDELEVIKSQVRQVMEGIYPLSVPLSVEMNIGRDWQNMT